MDNQAREAYEQKLRDAYKRGGEEELLQVALETYDLQQKEIHKLYDLAPMEAINIGKPLTQEDEDARKSQGVRFLSWDTTCIVSYRIAFRYGAAPEDWGTIRGRSYFPGTYNEFVEEVQTRIEALINRTPLPENIRGSRIDGVSDETMCDVLRILGPYHQAPELQEDYYERRSKLFRDQVWPQVPKTESDSMAWKNALDKFGKLAELSFEDMRKWGRGGPPHPKARTRL